MKEQKTFHDKALEQNDKAFEQNDKAIEQNDKAFEQITGGTVFGLEDIDEPEPWKFNENPPVSKPPRPEKQPFSRLDRIKRRKPK